MSKHVTFISTLIGAVASAIAIYVFFTGNTSLKINQKTDSNNNLPKKIEPRKTLLGIYYGDGTLKEVDTIFKPLKIIDKEGFYNNLILNEKKILKEDLRFLTFEYKYDLDKSTILLLYTSPGGSMTYPSYFIIEVFEDGHYVITDDFMSFDSTFKPTMYADKELSIDLGFENKAKKYIIYKDRKIRKAFKSIVDIPANEDDCNFLFNKIYLPAMHGKCQKTYLEQPNSIIRVTNSLNEDPRLNFEKLDDIMFNQCTVDNIVEYSEFKKEICNY